jgi:hypothetical protein
MSDNESTAQPGGLPAPEIRGEGTVTPPTPEQAEAARLRAEERAALGFGETGTAEHSAPATELPIAQPGGAMSPQATQEAADMERAQAEAFRRAATQPGPEAPDAAAREDAPEPDAKAQEG